MEISQYLSHLTGSNFTYGGDFLKYFNSFNAHPKYWNLISQYSALFGV